LSRSIASTAASPGIRINGNASLSGDSNNITAGLWATGTITAGGTIAPRIPNSSTVNFPSIDYSIYSSIADVTWPGSHSFSSFNSAVPTVIYVNGDVTINAGQYSGLTTVIATGTITVDGMMDPQTSDDFLALVTDKQITVASSLTATRMIMYCHNDSTSTPGVIEFQQPGLSGNTGSICADSFVCPAADNLYTFNRNAAFTRTIATQMKLPGSF